jgi:pimeloyl-ACP methyl ester carboxylesterase
MAILSVLAQAEPESTNTTVFKYGEPMGDAQVVPISKDSLRLAYRTDGSECVGKRDLFVCLPMLGLTSESYDELVRSFRQVDTSSTKNIKCPRWLRYELRGHGSSRIDGKDILDFRTMPQSQFQKYPNDVLKELRFELAPGTIQYDTSAITIIGASIGANTAALLTEQMPYIKRLILLSPGLNYKGLEPADAIMTFKGQILLVAAQGDEYSYNSVRELAALNPDHCTLMIFEGDAHGTDIINDSPDAIQALVDWLLKN